MTNGKDYELATVKPALQQIRTLLNYFASLAIDIEQGIYVEEIVKNNLDANIIRAVDKFINPSFKDEIDIEELALLVELRDKWRREQTPWYFRNIDD